MPGIWEKGVKALTALTTLKELARKSRILPMKTFTDYLWMNTKNQKEIVNITDQVEEAVRKSGVKEGIVLVNAMHITSSVFINDEEPVI